MSIKVTHNLHIIGNRKFPKDLFCDAWLTKDGVSLIPVHRVILAGVSEKFKKLFQWQDEEGGGKVHFVRTPLDYEILKRVVNFIYDGRIVLKSKEEHELYRKTARIADMGGFAVRELIKVNKVV